MLAGCLAILASGASARGATSATATGIASRSRTLGECVGMWNRAPLGEGRRTAAADAAYGRRVLLFAFSDGVCGVAFPARVPGAMGIGAVFISGLGGDYQWEPNPLSGPDHEPPSGTQLQAIAEGHTNARIAIPAGTVIADRGAVMATLRPAFMDTHADCEEVLTPSSADNASPGIYKLLRRTVSCPWVRTVVWAWSAREGTPSGATAPPAHLLIDGWRCAGSDLTQTLAGYQRVSCSKGKSVVKVETRAGPHRSGQLRSAAITRLASAQQRQQILAAWSRQRHALAVARELAHALCHPAL